MSQFKRFSNLDITKKLAKEKTVLNFIVYFAQVGSICFFFETQGSRLKIQLK